MAAKKNGKLSAIFKSGKGFTLTEMIVVLVVLAILAASGIGAASGYVKRSTLTKNDSNAETIYQAAQTALQQMEKSGGIFSYSDDKIITSEEWIKKLIKDEYAFPFTDKNLSKNMNDNSTYLSNAYVLNKFTTFNVTTPAKANESVHMRYVLNFSKNNATSDQSKLVKQLLQPYFSDSTVFMGAITIELDVEKSADAYGKLHNSAKCLSVFYDSRAAGGFPEAKLSADKKVPVRDTSHRADKSLIGYYDGYKGSVVDTVYLPKVQQGIVVKKFRNDISTEIIDIKNDADEVIEKQEITHGWLTWASTLDTANLNGNQKDVYYRFELLRGNTVDKIVILNEDFLLSGDAVGNSRHSIDYSALAGFGDKYKWEAHPQKPDVTVDEHEVVYNSDSDSDRFSRTITRKSITVIARVYVKDVDGYRGASSTDITSNTNDHLLPLKITYVDNEYNNDKSKKPAYIEYSLDITELMKDEINKARITIYPNYFSDGTMKSINDEKGIIPFKKGVDTDIDPLPPPKTIPLTDPDADTDPDANSEP